MVWLMGGVLAVLLTLGGLSMAVYIGIIVWLAREERRGHGR